MHRHPLLPFLFLLPLLASSCVVSLGSCGLRSNLHGSGVRVEERRALESFERLSVAGGFHVTVRAGREPRLVLRGDDNLLPHVRTDVRGGRLVLDFDSARNIHSERPIEVEIEVPRVGAVDVSGSCRLDLDGLEGESFALEVSGSCNAGIRGRVERLGVTISGSARLDLSELAAREARVRITGSGRVDVAAAERLEVAISGSGSVRYRGQPALVSRINGSGSVLAARD